MQQSVVVGRELHCVRSGEWFICPESTKYAFIGCCVVDPTSGDPCWYDCPAGNVRPATFSPTIYGKYINPTCEPSANFFACNSANKEDTFWGCCSGGENPCDKPDGHQGCGQNLRNAWLDKKEQRDQYAHLMASTLAKFVPQSSTTVIIIIAPSTGTSAAVSTTILTASSPIYNTPTTISNTTTAISTTSYSSSPIPTSTNIPAQTLDRNTGTQTSKIIGGAIGGAICLIVILALVAYIIRRAKTPRPVIRYEWDDPFL